MAGVKVISLQHSTFHDLRTGVMFHDAVVKHPVSGIKCHLGVAEDVDPKVAKQFYGNPDQFFVVGKSKGTDDDAPTGKPLGKLTKAELVERGGALGLKLSDAQPKAELVAAVADAEKAAEGAQQDDDDAGGDDDDD